MSILQLIEPCVIDEDFVTRLGRIDDIAETGVVRLVFASPEHVSGTDEIIDVVRAKLIVPQTSLVSMGRESLSAASPPGVTVTHVGLHDTAC